VRTWLLLGLAGAVGFYVLGHVRVLTQNGYVFCGFYATTGIPCPGCGLTRAIAALARGEIRTALRLHPFAPLLLVEAVVLWALGTRELLRRRALAPPPWLVERLLVWQGAALLALWLARLATGTLPR